MAAIDARIALGCAFLWLSRMRTWRSVVLKRLLLKSVCASYFRHHEHGGRLTPKALVGLVCGGSSGHARERKGAPETDV